VSLEIVDMHFDKDVVFCEYLLNVLSIFGQCLSSR
jgi:hypothetical protein